MSKPNIFFKLTKVDVAKREVTGIATAELPDLAGEVCDYESTKPYYQKWSEGIHKATGGKSLGNVREMHGNIAAGKVVSLDFDDAAKAIRIVTKCVDDSTWNKILEGVLTGFSQGGDYVKRWKDGDLWRYTADPSEVSYVDLPCLPEGTFEVVKADGASEVRKFHIKEVKVAPDLEQVWKAKDGSTWATKAEAKKQNELIDAQSAIAKTADPAQAIIDDIHNALDKRDFSDEERSKLAESGHALPDGSFPIENETDLENAVHAFGRAKDKDKAKAHIIARAKAIGATDKLPADWEGSTKKEEKSVKPDLKKFSCETWDAAMAIEALQAIECLLMGEMGEEEDGDDEAQQVADLKMVIERLKAFIASEIKEGTRDDGSLAAAAKADMTKASAASEEPSGEIHPDHMEHVHAIHKAAQHIMKKCMKCMSPEAEKILKAMADGEELQDHIKSIHKKATHIAEHAVSLGSKLPNDGQDAPEEEEDESATKFAKMAAINDGLTKTITTLTERLTEIQKRLVVVENSPAPRKGKLMNVQKGYEREEPESADESRPLNINGLSPEEARALYR